MQKPIKPIGVYIKVNNSGNITNIGSDIFIFDTSKWIKIDEGYGDKYAHAQSNYLSKPIIDISGKYNYIYKNGKIIEV